MTADAEIVTRTLDQVDIWWRGALEPEPQLTVSQWADRHRVLPATSADPGPWRTARAPYLREVMDALSTSSPWERVVLLAGAQIGKTEAGLNWLGFIVAHAPGLALLVQPSLEMARRNVVTRVDPMIAACPVLAERVAKPRSRDAGNSLWRKDFPGGQLVMTGANSPVGLRSTPARYLFLDEVDAYPADAEGEGDPVELAIARARTFGGRRKIFMCSTPTVKGASRIAAAYAEGDQRVREVPCRHCGAFSEIAWTDIRWPDGQPEKAEWVCPQCGGAHREGEKLALNAAGRWRATAEGDGRTASFRVSALLSPWFSWADAALAFLAARRDPVRKQVWVNTVLAEPYDPLGDQDLDPDDLATRREDWGPRLPSGVVVLTAGVDVQTDRLEATVWGWGGDGESWAIEHHVTWGDPTVPATWEALETWGKRTWPDAWGGRMGLSAVCIDTGGSATQSVYGWLHGKAGRRLWGVKGMSRRSEPLWPRRRTMAKSGVPIFSINVDAGKEAIFARLQLPTPGPGFIHLHAGLPPDFERQLTAERPVIRFTKGFPHHEWRLPNGARNEALDCAVYSMAALEGMKAEGFDLEAAAKAAAERRPVHQDLRPLPEPEGEETPGPALTPKALVVQRVVRRSTPSHYISG